MLQSEQSNNYNLLQIPQNYLQNISQNTKYFETQCYQQLYDEIFEEQKTDKSSFFDKYYYPPSPQKKKNVKAQFLDQNVKEAKIMEKSSSAEEYDSTVASTPRNSFFLEEINLSKQFSSQNDSYNNSLNQNNVDTNISINSQNNNNNNNNNGNITPNNQLLLLNNNETNISQSQNILNPFNNNFNLKNMDYCNLLNDDIVTANNSANDGKQILNLHSQLKEFHEKKWDQIEEQYFVQLEESLYDI